MRQSIRSKSEVDAPPSRASSSHSTNDDEINPDHVDNPPPARPTQVRPKVSPPPKNQSPRDAPNLSSFHHPNHQTTSEAEKLHNDKDNAERGIFRQTGVISKDVGI